jgi:hypothetical protein
VANLGCQQEMAKQPSCRPLEATEFFEDGRSARPLVPGTVAQGDLREDRPLFHEDRPLFTGKETNRREGFEAATLFGLGNSLSVAALAQGESSVFRILEYSDRFPFEVTEKTLERGRQRYMIFCAVCHDPSGNGNGRIVQRGYTRPPSYITDHSRGFERRGIHILLRDVPVGYYFDVVGNGFGAMPDYAAQVPPHDRWAIIAYIRALQFSQYAPLHELPETERRTALEALEGKR